MQDDIFLSDVIHDINISEIWQHMFWLRNYFSAMF